MTTEPQSGQAAHADDVDAPRKPTTTAIDTADAWAAVDATATGAGSPAASGAADPLHHVDDEDPHNSDLDDDNENGDPDDDSDDADRAKRRARWNLFFWGFIVVFIGGVVLAIYFVFLKPSAPRAEPTSFDAPSLQDGLQRRGDSPGSGDGRNLTPAEPARASSPGGDVRVEGREPSDVVVAPGAPQSERSAPGRVSQQDGAQFGNDLEVEPLSTGPGLGSEPRPSAPLPDIERKVDTIAVNLVQVNVEIVNLQQRLAAMESGQKEILDAVNRLGSQNQDKKAASASSASAEKRVADARTAPRVAASGPASKAAPAAQQRQPAGGGSKLAGLWVKGTYPTTGAATEMAWVMNGDGQLEATVRVGSTVRGAKVTGFDGMKVLTTAGVIHPR